MQFAFICFFFFIRFIPQKFEPAEMKKIRLQEKMSGLKHHFSIENEGNAKKESCQPNDASEQIDPIDECKIHKNNSSGNEQIYANT